MTMNPVTPVTITTMKQAEVRFTYTNHRGETAVRRARPMALIFGFDHWHPEPQWLMVATDLDKMETRHFALTRCLFIPQGAEDGQG